MGAGVGGELIDLRALSALDLERWRDLAARAVAPNPFFEPEYVLPLARALGQEAAVQLLVVRDGADWHACLPVHLTTRWHRVPLRSLATWRGYYLYSPLGTPLVSSDHPAESLSVLLDAMRRLDRRARFAALELVAEDRGLREPLADALAGLSPPPLVVDRFERAAVCRRADLGSLEERLGPSRRRTLRRQRRRLAEALGGQIEAVNNAGDEGATERFVAMEAAGWKGREGTALGADPDHVSFFKEMSRGFSELGRLQLFELQGPGQTIAMKCNLLAGDTVFLYKEAYDESWSAYSPGMLLELDMLLRFYESDATFIDSCANRNNAMFNRLLPDRRPIATLAIPAPGMSGHAVRPALAAARFMRRRRRR